MDHLWRHVKVDVAANEPTPKVDETVRRARRYIRSLTPRERLQKLACCRLISGSLMSSYNIHVKRLLSTYLIIGCASNTLPFACFARWITK